jgi:phage shock protein C
MSITKLTKKFYRSREDRIWAGVCGGAAAYLNFDSSVTRLVYILITCFTGFVPGIIAYLVAAAVIPLEPPSITKTSKN